MKEELQTKLVEILASIQTAAGKAGDFALSQLPDIAQSYVAYGRLTATVMLLGSVAWFIASIFALIWAKRVCKQPGAIDEFDAFCGIGVGMVGVVSVVISLICAANTFTSAALVWMAPKVWLLKELANMIR